MDRLPGGGGQPPKVPAGPHAANEDALVQGMTRHSDPVAQHGAAGKRAAWVDGNHPDRLAAVANHLDEGVRERALAGSRRAGQTHQVAVAGVQLEFGGQLGRLGITIFRQADGPRQRPDITGKQGAGQTHLQFILAAEVSAG